MLRSTLCGCVAVVALFACGRTPVLGDLPVGPESTDGIGKSGLYVAVGANGTMVRSETGAQWAVSTSGVTQTLSSIAADGERFVAVGKDGTILTSEDGVTWSARASGTTVDLEHVLFDGERFFAVGGDWTAGAVTLKSADGTSWEAIASPESHMFHSAARLGDRVVAAGRYRSDLQTPAVFSRTVTASSAETEWRSRAGPDFSDAVTVDGALWIVSGDRVASTSDLEQWTEHTLPGNQPHRAIAWSGSSFVVVGEQGAVHRSLDGQDWTARHTGLNDAWFTSVAHGEPGFVAVGGEGVLITSTDGSTWTRAGSGTSMTLLDVTFRAR